MVAKMTKKDSHQESECQGFQFCFSVNINVDLYRIVHEKSFLLHFLAKFSKVAEVTINAKQIESFRPR